jgi:hypothetical protein
MSDSDSNQLPEWQPSQPRKRSTLPGTGDLSRRLMDDMDPEVLEFLKTTVNSFIKWDLVIFLLRTAHHGDRQCRALYRARLDGDQQDLEDLVKAGVLEQHTSGTLTVYSLTQDADSRKDQAFCFGQR